MNPPIAAGQVSVPPSTIPTFSETTRQAPSSSTTWNKTSSDPTARRIGAAKAYDDAGKEGLEALQRQKEAALELQRLEEEHERQKAEAVAAAQRQHAENEARRSQHFEALKSQEARAREELATAAANRDRGYWEDKSTGARILSAILVGMGEAVSDNGPSAASRILDAKMAEDRAIKENKYAHALGNVGAAEKATAAIGGEYDRIGERIRNEQIVSLQVLTSQLEAAKRRLPGKAAEFDKLIAETQQKIASETMEQEKALARTVSRGGTDTEHGDIVRSVDGEKPGATGGGGVGAAAAAKGEIQALSFDENAATIARGQGIAEKDPEAVERLKEAITAEELAAKEGGLTKAFTLLGQRFLGNPSGVATRLAGDENALALLHAYKVVGSTVGKSLDPGSETLSEGQVKEGAETVGIGGQTPQSFAKLLREQAEGQRTRAKVVRSSLTPKAPAAAAAPSAPSNAAPGVGEAIKYLQSLPASQRNKGSAGAVRARLKSMGALPDGL